MTNRAFEPLTEPKGLDELGALNATQLGRHGRMIRTVTRMILASVCSMAAPQ